MDRLTVKFDDNSQIVIKTKRNTAMNYWEVDYAHKVHHIQEAYIDTYPLKNHSRKWLVGGPLDFAPNTVEIGSDSSGYSLIDYR